MRWPARSGVLGAILESHSFAWPIIPGGLRLDLWARSLQRRTKSPTMGRSPQNTILALHCLSPFLDAHQRWLATSFWSAQAEVGGPLSRVAV